ncbi:expansin-A16 [Primulina huaijiensis]|uniref:expansin-A16 n=1 Tax=Primulina huaijiensis TaxID=1492673 RepID=UPI003CC79668
MGAIIYFHATLSLCYLLVLSASQDEEWRSATATSDGSTLTEGACGFGDLDRQYYGMYSAGISSILFSRGSTCGACFEVRCVDHILWCLQGSPSIVLTATDFCPPNYGLPADFGGWCNFPRAHFHISRPAFSRIAHQTADIVPIQYRRVKCERKGGIRYTLSGGAYFLQILITNVGSDGEVVAVKVKGSRTGWVPMGRNWGQNWQCNIELAGQPLSFELTTITRMTLTSYNVAPQNWKYGQTFQGKQF